MSQQNGNGHGAGIEIRDLGFEDLAPVFHLGERLFTAERTPTLYRTFDEYELLNLFINSPDTCLVAEREDEIVGFALGTVISKRRSAWDYGYLIWLGVAPEIKGQGLGKRLVQTMTKRFLAEGARIMMIDTEAHSAAEKFFKRLGFGNPRAHVYMSMHISQAQEANARAKEKESGDQ